MNTPTLLQPDHCEVRFQSLFDPGRALAFPCDDRGHVDLDQLSDLAQQKHRWASASVGREFSIPTVRCDSLH